MDEENQHLLLTNLKVGFTALNAQFPAKVRRLSNNPAEAAAQLEAADYNRVTFFVRDPIQRWMSFYYHWFINNPLVGSPPSLNRQFELLRRVADEEFFDHFVKLTPKERTDEEVMRTYCKYFPLVYLNDGHSTYQMAVLQNLNIKHCEINNIVDLEQLSSFMNHEYGIDFKKQLVSGRPDAVPDFVQQMCRVLYAVDYSFINGG
ncbi:sulfotransferase family 2 domain-containing protein [Maricaulaceae bacterium EIL42A08]|nr:sulfotransferase family 2 domain-containing protein [Maricaulaceae bacterium EIL42A08]